MQNNPVSQVRETVISVNLLQCVELSPFIWDQKYNTLFPIRITPGTMDKWLQQQHQQSGFSTLKAASFPLDPYITYLVFISIFVHLLNPKKNSLWGPLVCANIHTIRPRSSYPLYIVTDL